MIQNYPQITYSFDFYQSQVDLWGDYKTRNETR